MPTLARTFPMMKSQGPPDKRRVIRHDAPSIPANAGDRSGTHYPLKPGSSKPRQPTPVQGGKRRRAR